MSKMKLSSRQVAMIAIFAALYAVISRLPGIPTIGGGGRIEPVVILDPIVGILLGPWVGGLTSLLGNSVAWIIPSVSFYGLLNLPTGPVAAIVSGCLARNTKYSNWKVAAIVYALLMGVWYLTPPGLELYYYPFLHWIAFALILVFRERTHLFLNAEAKVKKVLGATICSFGAIMANHMMGNLIFIGSVGWFVSLKAIKDTIKSLGFFWLKSGLPHPEDPLAAIFAAVLPITIAERLLFTVFTVYLAYGLVIALRKSGLIDMG
ncbi:MAG: ECF transporter S component [Candidatus Bathyarchaeota archaeon]|nr:MAG: ECF transporter S component [Candidatus Bathyarchaeota archaeon]